MAVPVRTVLVSRDRLALALIDCVAYSSGFEFSIAVRSLDEIDPERMGFMPRGPGETDMGIQVSIAYPGGGAGATAPPLHPELKAYYEAAMEGVERPLPTGPVVMQRSGSGGGGQYDFRFWCWPLPPAGTITLTLEWKGGGVTATGVDLDATAIHAAGSRSAPLWS